MKKSIYNTPEMNVIHVNPSTVISTSLTSVNVDFSSEMDESAEFE